MANEQKSIQLPAGNAFPLQNNGSSHPRLNSSAGKYSAAVVPGIQEHENRAQLSPGKGYLSLKMSRNNKIIYRYYAEKGKGEMKITPLQPKEKLTIYCRF
jgi:hypothetical protein